jgi:hypothetical protein
VTAQSDQDRLVLQRFVELCEIYNDRDRALADLPYLISHMEVIDQNTGRPFQLQACRASRWSRAK